MKNLAKIFGTLPETNISPENRPLDFRKVLLLNIIFRGENVSFREGTSSEPCNEAWVLLEPSNPHSFRRSPDSFPGGMLSHCVMSHPHEKNPQKVRQQVIFQVTWNSLRSPFERVKQVTSRIARRIDPIPPGEICPQKSRRLVQLTTIFGGSNRGVIRWDLYPFWGIKHGNSYKFLFFDMMTLGLVM